MIRYSKVDLSKGLNAIEARVNNSEYTNDYDFQEDLLTLFNGLNDAHTWYGTPRGYSDCLVVRPFNLRATLGENKQMIVILNEGTLQRGVTFYEVCIESSVQGLWQMNYLLIQLGLIPHRFLEKRSFLLMEFLS
jgi:hypothetical protein